MYSLAGTLRVGAAEGVARTRLSRCRVRFAMKGLRLLDLAAFP